MNMIDRCGKCENCQKVLKARKLVLKAMNPPFSHVDDDVVQLWNDTLQEYPCTERVLLFVGEPESFADGKHGLLSSLIYDYTDYNTASDVDARLELVREDLQRYGMSDFVHNSRRLRFFTPDIRDRVRKAVEVAGLAFWEKIAEYFPEAQTGDGGDGFETAVTPEVVDWVICNTLDILDPEEDNDVTAEVLTMKANRKKLLGMLTD